MPVLNIALSVEGMLSWMQMPVSGLQLAFAIWWLAVLIVRTDADLVVASVDKNLTVFLKKYFPKETKAKQQDNDIAASIEMYGEDFANVKCLVM